MVVFTIFFGKLAKMPSDNIPYPIFSYTGLLPWGEHLCWDVVFDAPIGGGDGTSA